MNAAQDRPDSSPKPNILVVDDKPDNLRLLSTILTQHHYRVRSVTNGQMALKTVLAEPPDLILLDIMMPELGGYEVCRQLKANPQTQGIPVIFISALNETMDKVTAFGVGGADYITKPLQSEEVLARVKNQLTLYRLQQELQRQNAELQRAEVKYRSIFENAAEGIYQISPQGDYLTVNPSLSRICGYESPSVMLQSVANITQLYVDPQRWGKFQYLISEEGSISNLESAIRYGENQQVWIKENARPVYDPDGNLLYYEGTVEDISARRQGEELLAQQMSRFVEVEQQLSQLRQQVISLGATPVC
ncbi:MAG: response regulator [Cyanobacteriota bacterium]|nr:response regulator [Cyanobacteriota bacterium]